jgi:hypothetical protein
MTYYCTLITLHWMLWAGVAQSVWCLTTDWTTGAWTPAEAKDFSSSLCVQTISGAHPASYPMGIGGPFPGGKTRLGCGADDSPPLVPRSWMSRSCTSSSPCPSVGMLGDRFTFYTECWKLRFYLERSWNTFLCVLGGEEIWEVRGFWRSVHG